MSVTYPLDLTGNAPSNLVQNELHSVAESVFRDYYFIVPKFAPFYINNFSLSITVNNNTTLLVEDVDYSFALEYVTGTRVTGKAMYGAVTLHNLNLNGILSMTYQTIGGENVADRLAVLTYLAERAYNPRTTIFDLVLNTPGSFPPARHNSSIDDVYGQQELVNKLGEIRDAIIQNSSLTQAVMTNTLNSSYINKTGGTMTGPLTLFGAPTDPLHAVTKKYVDDRINELLAIINNNNLNSY